MARAARDLQMRATQLYEARDLPSVPWDRLPPWNRQILTRMMVRVLSAVPEPLNIRPLDVTEWFGVSDRTAREWLSDCSGK